MSGHERHRYEVNGQVYDSLDDLPPELRSKVAGLLADHDGDGIPDIFAAGDQSVSVVSQSERYVVDGVTYDSLDDVPESARAHLARLRASPPAQQSAERVTAPTMPLENAQPSPIVQRAGVSNRTKLLLAFVAVDAVAVGVIAWLILR